MISVSYNAYCAITKEGDNDIWTVRPRGVVPLLLLCSQIDVGATVNTLLGDTFSRENNTHGSRFHDRDPQFASRILGAMTQSCYIGTRDIRSRVIRGLYCIYVSKLTIIGSDNGLSPGRCQATTSTNAGIVLIGFVGTNFSEILIEIYTFSFKKMHLKKSSLENGGHFVSDSMC